MSAFYLLCSEVFFVCFDMFGWKGMQAKAAFGVGQVLLLNILPLLVFELFVWLEQTKAC